MILARKEMGRMELEKERKGKELCPLCGERMRPAQTKKEKGVYLIWYECLQKNCPGWLVQNEKCLST